MEDEHRFDEATGSGGEGPVRRSPLALPYLLGSLLLVLTPLLLALGLAFTSYFGFRAPVPTGSRTCRGSSPTRCSGERSASARWSPWSSCRSGCSWPWGRPCCCRGAAGRPPRWDGASAYLPSVIPDAAWALLWLWILNPLYGPLPALLEALGVPDPGFLTTPWGARLGLVLVLAFQVGEAFVVALAARAVIPARLHEAIEVEGGSPWFATTRVTLPLMLPIVLVLAVRDVVVVVQNAFVPALLVTEGGPANATLTAPLLIYRRAFEYGELGYASTLSVTLLVLTGLAAALPLWLAARLAARQRTRA